MKSLLCFLNPRGRRRNHRERQMKFFAGPKFKKKVEGDMWKMATKPRDGWGKVFNP